MPKDKEEKTEQKEEAEEEIQSISDSDYKLTMAKLLNAVVIELQKHNILLETQNKLIEIGMKK